MSLLLFFSNSHSLYLLKLVLSIPQPPASAPPPPPQGIDGLRNQKQEEDHLFEHPEFCQSCRTEQVDDPDSPGAKRPVVDCRSELDIARES